MPLKCVRRPKSPYWIIRGTIRGIRIEESTGVNDRRRAEEIRAKREAELIAQSVYGRRAVATFAEAALSYLEQDGSKRFMEPIVRHFGTTALAVIDQDALDRAAVKLYPNVATSTRNRQFYTPASAVLHHAARRGWCPRPFIQRPGAGTNRMRWISVEEADKLIASSAAHLRPLLIFLLYTGARVGEALWLDWCDVDLDRAHATFPKTKNGEARGVPLHPRVIAALKRLSHRDGQIFRRPDGRAYARPKGGEDHSAGSRIKTASNGACRRAGIEDFHPHDLRHTWATWHYQANRDLGALQRLGGWKSVRMVMRYAHTNVAELSHTINALSGGKLGEAKPQKTKRKGISIR
jgi:integrase